MTIETLYQIFNEHIPPSLSCSWDNDGLMCCAEPQKEVHRILITLDVTASCIDHAIREGYDAIVSHHPLIFRGMSSVCARQPLAHKVISLLRANIAVMSFHTRLDAVAGGVNDVLADLLGLQHVIPFGEEGIGRIGTLPNPITAKDFALSVKTKLHAPYVNLADTGRPVRRVAVLGGSGSDDVEAAKAAGADTYVSGELKYHLLCDATETNINLIEAGHFYTEYPICEKLKQQLLSWEETLICDIYSHNTVCTL